MTSSAELEREAIALRQRLTVAASALREALAPARLIGEVKDRVGGPSGESAFKRIERGIRTYPLPSMLMGIGSTLLLRSKWHDAPSPGAGATDSLYEAVKVQSADHLQGLTAMAVAKVGAATDRALGTAEAALDTSIAKVAAYARTRPVAFAFFAVVLGAAASAVLLKEQ